MSIPAGFEFVDAPGEQGNPVQTSQDLNCEYCGTGLIYGGVGRKPRFCEEHKRPQDRGEKEPSKPIGRPSGKGLRVTSAIESLEFVYKVAGTGLNYVDPVASKVVTDNATKLAESYRRMLETNDKFLKLFETADEKMAWLPIVITHGQIAMAIVASRADSNRDTRVPTTQEGPRLYDVNGVNFPGVDNGVV